MVQVVINRIPHTVPEGGSVLDALRAAGVRVPALCHDDRIAPTGACRLCLVRIENAPKLVPACSTPLGAGMVIETDTAELEELRRSLLEMLVRRYPVAAAESFPEEPFHQAIRQHGPIARAPATTMEPAGLEDRSHPYITLDPARCIYCYRCVRICAELQGQDVWHVRGRGVDTRIVPDGPTLLESSCVGCGACVDTCPTGALEDRRTTASSLPAAWTRTVCPYCGVGCEINVGTTQGRIVRIEPVLDSAVSKGHLCVKGRYAFEFVEAADRITTPMIRDADGWSAVSWDEARAFVVQALQDLVRRHGPDSIGILGSARATNEDNYLIQKFARAVIGTNNVDCCARVCHAPSAAALKRVLGAGLATNSYDDIEIARTILVCGANATESHPVVGARIKQAARRGARLIVIDPRGTELARRADVHLAIRPGTNIPLLNAMAHTIVREELYDREFVARRLSGFDTFRGHVESWTPERAATLCGVEADAIRLAARSYAAHGPALSVHGLGLTEHVQGTDGVLALVNLALLTGNVGKPGSGINPLRGQNNVQGSAHMGCDPALLAGSVPIETGRDACERRWGVRLPTHRGLGVLEMMDAALGGRLKALWAVGYDVLLSNPQVAETARALRALDFVVVQDMFLTRTAREYGSVFLPACSSFEKDGTFMSAERRIQRVRAAVPPAGGSRPDWQILAEFARAMGAAGFDFTSPAEIWDEVRVLCEGARGMSYDRLDRSGLQWPCPADDHPGTSILHAGTFASGDRAALQPVEYRPTIEATSAGFPFQLITGRSLYQFNAGTMTGRTPNNDLRPADVLDISPGDARSASIADGHPVRITSRYGSIVLPAHLDPAIQPGQLFATFHRPDVLVNMVTGPHRDAVTGTPEYKVTAVRIERTGP
jgi:formate dehydrogenase major subunit